MNEIDNVLSILDVNIYYDYIIHLAINIVLELGLRCDEIGGLEWEKIDFENSCINIKTNLIYTNTTLMLQEGTNYKVIQKRLGHADISTTLNIYAHVDIEMQKDATEKLNKLLSR